MKRHLQQLYDVRTFTFKCPDCGATVPYFDVKIGFKLRYETDSFECTNCKSLLCVSRTYAWAVFLGTMGVAVGVVEVLKVRPMWLFAVTALLAWVLVSMIAGIYVKWLFPPRILHYVSDDLALFVRR
jgi:hypothetical protein